VNGCHLKNLLYNAIGVLLVSSPPDTSKPPLRPERQRALARELVSRQTHDRDGLARGESRVARLPVRIFLCPQYADMRRSFDGLAQMVREFLGADPLSGHLFVFRSKRGDRLKPTLANARSSRYRASGFVEVALANSPTDFGPSLRWSAIPNFAAA
jgi:hypothetical protein